MVSGLILTSLYTLSLFFIWYKIVEGFPVDSDGKESACSVGGPDSTLGSGLNTLGSRREGNGNPLHYSCLENTTDRGVWRAIVHQATKSWTRQSN